jgi:flagellar biosynthesis/type III secretory pathway chaperone
MQNTQEQLTQEQLTQEYLTVINLWKQDYQSLYEALELEQQSLEKSDFQQLAHAIKLKDDILNKISQHQPPKPVNGTNCVHLSSMLDFKHHCEESSDTRNEWKSLSSLVKQCHFKNEVNSKLIELLYQSNQRIFNLIKGFDPDNNIYNANGNSQQVRHSSGSLSA